MQWPEVRLLPVCPILNPTPGAAGGIEGLALLIRNLLPRAVDDFSAFMVLHYYISLFNQPDHTVDLASCGKFNSHDSQLTSLDVPQSPLLLP